jgi:DNA polymerase-3 subunit delta'
VSTSSLPPLAPWQQRAYDQAAAALDAGRLGHALLFCGPARLGKRLVAERLAQRVLCPSRAPGGEPCGTCRSCTLYAARVQHDPPELRPDGTPAHPWGRPGHPDVRFLGFATNERTGKARTEIVIDQVRALSQALALTPQMGVAQVALVEPADAIGHAAANALLKTLEEPQPGRYLWLVASEPARLPATIRSRCQKLEFRLPPRDEALAWLRAQGHDAKLAGEALEAARGHPGQAAAWLAGGGLALRREVAKDLDALARGDASATATAQRWTGDGQAALRLRFAADLALEHATQAQATAGRAAADLTASARTRRLAAWFDAANRTAALLRTQVRADLAVAELLSGWSPQARGTK